MNDENIGRWRALGAHFGVVIGWLPLLVEFRQNARKMQSNIHQGRTDTALAKQLATGKSHCTYTQ